MPPQNTKIDLVLMTNSVLLLEVVESSSNHRLQLHNNSYSQGLISARFFKNEHPCEEPSPCVRWQRPRELGDVMFEFTCDQRRFAVKSFNVGLRSG